MSGSLKDVPSRKFPLKDLKQGYSSGPGLEPEASPALRLLLSPSALTLRGRSFWVLSVSLCMPAVSSPPLLLPRALCLGHHSPRSPTGSASSASLAPWLAGALILETPGRTGGHLFIFSGHTMYVTPSWISGPLWFSQQWSGSSTSNSGDPLVRRPGHSSV